MQIDKLVRPHIKKVKPYSSARDEFEGLAEIFLDANENSLGSPLIKWYNRYPDPHQQMLKKAISEIKGIDNQSIFLGNGSDECIDLLFRCFCEPTIDNVIICPPTYGMYEVSAAINNVATKKVLLTESYQLNLKEIENAIDINTKIIWICSPNNPTGNSLHIADIEMILNNFDGLVVVDEAYINFSKHKSFTHLLADYPQLVVLQTFSKAWGLAGLRLGMAFASPEIIHWLNIIKPPYNINQATQELALEAMGNLQQTNAMIKEIVAMREQLIPELIKFSIVEKVFPSDANFLLVKIKNAHAVYAYLTTEGIVVRDRSKVVLCDDCLRITVGTYEENSQLLQAMANYDINFIPLK